MRVQFLLDQGDLNPFLLNADAEAGKNVNRSGEP
jgi:hypothetical protein